MRPGAWSTQTVCGLTSLKAKPRRIRKLSHRSLGNPDFQVPHQRTSARPRDTLEDVAKALRKAGESLSDDAGAALAQATLALRDAAQRVADKAPPEARYVAEEAVAEAKAHPIATAAAALSAAAALVTLLGLARRKPA